VVRTGVCVTALVLGVALLLAAPVAAAPRCVVVPPAGAAALPTDGSNATVVIPSVSCDPGAGTGGLGGGGGGSIGDGGGGGIPFTGSETLAVLVVALAALLVGVLVVRRSRRTD
jgi:hypothetical protein